MGVERRIVSVLFCDLVDFTPLSERFDAEDVATIQQAYFSAAQEAVQRYQGRIEKFIGDAVMAVFGVPVARDDDTERAVRAALAITRGAARVASSLDLDEDVLRIRAAVNTGEVVISAEAVSGESVVTGDIVNVAARLQAAAPVGGVLVGEETALAVDGSIELSAVPPLDLKGKSKPVRAFEAVGPRPTPSRDYVMGEMRSPMLGRELELQELLGLWERARAGEVVGVTILAPPGTGKSRLTAELAALVDGPVLMARCGLNDASPFDPIAKLLVSAFGIEAPDAQAIKGALRAAGEGFSESKLSVLASEVSRLVFKVPQDSQTEGADQRDLRFDAWSTALQALSGSPAVWIIEDLHRAGDDLLAFIDYVLELPMSEGLLVVGTARSSYLERRGVEDGEGIMHLQSLPPTAAEALVQSLVGDGLPGPIVSAIAERSDGNPLFIEELLRTWVGLGVLVRDEKAWHLTVAPGTIVLPTTVHALYAAQLDDLPGPARDVARKGSISGRRFPGSALEDLGVSEADAGLDVLTRRAIVSGPEIEAVVGDIYTYRHALLREAGYASLGRAERARLHLRLARWIEQAAGKRVEDVAELVANHHAWALENAPALGLSIEGVALDELKIRTAAWLERAGDAAAKAAALSGAASLYRRSLEITPSDLTLDQVRRSTLLGAALATTGSKNEALEHLRYAWEMAPELDLSTDEGRAVFARAATALGEAELEQLHFEATERLSADALASLGDREDAATARLRLLHAYAENALTNEIEPLRRVTEEVLHSAREHNDRELEMRALALRAQGLEDWQRIEELARELGDPRAVCNALNNQASYVRLDRAAEARAALARSEEIADAYGLTEVLGWVHHQRVETEFALGDWDAAAVSGMRSLEIAERFAYHRMAFRTWSPLLPLAGTTGRVDMVIRARDWFDQQRDSLPNPPSPYGLVVMTAAHWWIAETLGDSSELPDESALAEAIREHTYAAPSYVAAVETLVRAYLQRGRLRSARAVTDALRSLPVVLTEAWTIRGGVKLLLQAELLLLEGSDAGAVEAAGREAVLSLRELGAVWWLSKALRLLERAGRATPAEVDEAIGIERALGIPAEKR